MNRVIYPGSFDPCTHGHLDLIERGAKQVGELVVAVANNPQKRPLFTVTERVDMLKNSVQHLKNVVVESMEGLLVDYAVQRKADAILRGLRAVSDFEFEFQLAHMNRRLAPNLETLFMMTGDTHFYVSSKLVREIASFGGNVGDVVPEHVAVALKEKYSSAG